MIEKAREEAINILEYDPGLINYPLLKEIITDESENKFIHDFLN